MFDLGAIRLTTEQGLNKIRVSPNDFNLYEIIYYNKKAELLLLLYIKGTGSQTSNSASMVTIYEMTKDINDGYGTLHIDVNGNPEFLYTYSCHIVFV